MLVNEPKSDQKDLKEGKFEIAFATLRKSVYGLQTCRALYPFEKYSHNYPRRSSDSRSFAAIPQMNLPRKTPVELPRYESEVRSK
jgi:hypothetical protein